MYTGTVLVGTVSFSSVTDIWACRHNHAVGKGSAIDVALELAPEYANNQPLSPHPPLQALLALLLGPLPGAAAAPASAAAFQGAGGRVFYYDGLLEVLLERGVIEPGITALGGASSGAVTALYTALGLSATEQRDLNVATALGMMTGASFSDSLREVLTRELPDNVTDIGEAYRLRNASHKSEETGAGTQKTPLEP